MKTLLEILDAAGGIDAVTHIEVDNPPFMRLVIEVLPHHGPDGHRVISIAHYGKQNGDPTRDPEVCAEVIRRDEGPVLWPYYIRNDYAGFEQWSRWRDGDGNVICLPERTREMEAFLVMWDRNLRDQGFLAAYRRAYAPVGGQR